MIGIKSKEGIMTSEQRQAIVDHWGKFYESSPTPFIQVKKPKMRIDFGNLPDKTVVYEVCYDGSIRNIHVHN